MITKVRFHKLLEPSYIGKVKTRNRIIKPAATMDFSDDKGCLTEKNVFFYELLARGGVGLIILECVAVDYPLGAQAHSTLHLDDDKYIAHFSELTRAVHKHGCPIFIQLFHAGAWHPPYVGGLQAVSSSCLTGDDLPEPLYYESRELTTREIEDILNKFAMAAERAHKAGFDGVEINASSGHLLNSFLSRFWNRRQDTYGCQDLESRTRFVVEIIRAIKLRVGWDFPISVIFNTVEYGIDRGTTLDESKGFARIFENAGADVLNVRIFGFGDYCLADTPEELFYPESPKTLAKELNWRHGGAGASIPIVEAIKKVVRIPVIAVGRLEPKLGQEILRKGRADFVGLNRALIADPELPNKVAAGRMEDIAPCTACLHCVSAIISLEPVVCRVNAALGEDPQHVFKQAEKKKKVLVVGGGPAGMEAARVSAMRGHEVILYEKERKLGGLLPLAAVVKDVEIEDLPALVRYFKTQITKLGIKIMLGREINSSVIEEIKPEAVILATGGIPTVPKIPGIGGPNVVSSSKLHRKLKFYLRFLSPKVLRWLTRFWMPLGKKLVIVGGGIQGCELAEFLTKRGRQVTIVETADSIGEGVPAAKQVRLLSWLNKKGVAMMPKAKYEEITDKGLVIITKEGSRQTIEADTLVLAMPLSPDNELFKILDGKVPEIHLIGDCREPGLILDAIADGFRIGCVCCS